MCSSVYCGQSEICRWIFLLIERGDIIPGPSYTKRRRANPTFLSHLPYGALMSLSWYHCEICAIILHVRHLLEAGYGPMFIKCSLLSRRRTDFEKSVLKRGYFFLVHNKISKKKIKIFSIIYLTRARLSRQR